MIDYQVTRARRTIDRLQAAAHAAESGDPLAAIDALDAAHTLRELAHAILSAIQRPEDRA